MADCSVLSEILKKKYISNSSNMCFYFFTIINYKVGTTILLEQYRFGFDL